MTAIAGTSRARALSSALREARRAIGMGQRELGRQLQMSNTQLSHWESGQRVPNIEQVAMILTALRVSSEERERILDLARNVSEPNWLTVGVKGIPRQLAGVVECERSATSITEWASHIIPGLVQTTEYTRNIKLTGGLATTETELRVMVSSSRREVLTRRDPVAFEALIGEAALHDTIGSQDVMVEQLHHLLDIAAQRHVSIRIVRQGIGWHPGLVGPYILFEFADASPVVYFEHHSSGAFVPTEHDVAEYQKASDWIRSSALDREESMSLIRKIAEERINSHVG